MCVTFAGHKETPSCETIKQMHLILVMKYIVKTLIEFLVTNNAWYQQCSILYSQENLDDLFEEENADPSDIILEAVGFTKGDHSGVNQEKMKLYAFLHILDHNKFILSKAGLHFDWLSMTSISRAKIVASHLDAATMAFDSQIQAFVNIILQYKHGSGIFGHCKAYYGMVEVQGRENSSPQVLYDCMVTENEFLVKLFKWLESIITLCDVDKMDPRLETPPQVVDMDKDSYKHEFIEFLSHLAVECNWYVHNNTCFKHLKNCEQRDDITCTVNASARINTRYTQFIGSGEAAKATVFYTTEYVTKSDLPLHVGLQALDYAMKMYQRGITKHVNAIMGKEEIYLVGGGDYYTSHIFHAFKWYDFVNTM
ncbi:hypothetical protein EV702DRAFT_1177554 [Suillus placidus]|uniref:Uncharacterized protein n=1 Tax=Suillus placidus TaxID=48579 RepID=A0A9P7A3W3_9AGAM|nr:hypothetical protein EV702DRAFT_1177554 [Suillus placidus]